MSIKLPEPITISKKLAQELDELLKMLLALQEK